MPNLIDSNATILTKNLFYSLKSLMGNHILFGQAHFYTRTCSGYGTIGQYPVDCYEITGKYPMILSDDYQWEKRAVVQHYDSGGIIQMAWGMYNPCNIVVGTDGKDYACVLEHTSSAALNKPITGSDCWTYWQQTGTTGYGDVWQDEYLYDQNNHPIQQILTGGARNAYYHALLDDLADYFNNLIGADSNLIPVIFRPFHEMDGTWFWWGSWTGDGANTDAEYIQLWQETVEYLRDTKNVHNLLWCWNSDRINTANSTLFLEMYPGNSYVDIIGLDCYDSSVLVARCQTVVNEAVSRGKIAGICEFSKDATTGINEDTNYWTTEFIDLILADSTALKIAFACSFSNSATTYFGPGWEHADEPDFLTFEQNAKIWMLEDSNIDFYGSNTVITGATLRNLAIN